MGENQPNTDALGAAIEPKNRARQAGTGGTGNYGSEPNRCSLNRTLAPLESLRREESTGIAQLRAALARFAAADDF